jgi:hypothetical protein
LKKAELVKVAVQTVCLRVEGDAWMVRERRDGFFEFRGA